MGEIKCFWLEPTGRAKQYLRRYTPDFGACSGPLTYHDVSVEIGTIPDDRKPIACHKGEFADDPRWPKECVCGYEFMETDMWQVPYSAIMRRMDTGEEMTWREAPPGAMRDATWLHDIKGYESQDGKVLVVKLPVGEWVIDGPASGGGKWTRTGSPPIITARPSIGVLKKDGGFAYHAFLTDGILREC